MHHNPLRIGLIDGKQRDHVGAARLRQHHFIRSGDAERDLGIGNHLHHRCAGAALDDLDVKTAFFETTGELSGIKAAELRLRLPVEREFESRQFNSLSSLSRVRKNSQG